MAGTEKITEKIISQAREQADERVNQAQKDAEALLQRAQARAKDSAAAIEAQCKLDMAEQERRAMSVVDLDSRKRELAAKRDVLNETFDKALAGFEAFDEARYRAAYVQIVQAAIAKGSEEIVPAKADEAVLGQAFVDELNARIARNGLKGELKLGASSDEIARGCIVRDGGMEMNFSTRAVLRTVREECEGDIAAQLFPAQQEG